MINEDSNGLMNQAIIEMCSIRNHLNNTKPGKEFMFERFKEACNLLSNKGPKTPKSDEIHYYDSSDSVASKYFLANDNSQFNELFNCTRFFAYHEGASEQFATALAMVFVGDKNIKCYPIKLTFSIQSQDETITRERYANFVQFVDDNGILLHSAGIDIFDNVATFDSFYDFIDHETKIIAKPKETVLNTTFDGLNYFKPDLDISKNFTIFQQLTDDGGVSFNAEGYDFDYQNAEFAKCANLTNYMSKKELKEHLNTYLSKQKTME